MVNFDVIKEIKLKQSRLKNLNTNPLIRSWDLDDWLKDTERLLKRKFGKDSDYYKEFLRIGNQDILQFRFPKEEYEDLLDLIIQNESVDVISKPQTMSQNFYINQSQTQHVNLDIEFNKVLNEIQHNPNIATKALFG